MLSSIHKLLMQRLGVQVDGAGVEMSPDSEMEPGAIHGRTGTAPTDVAQAAVAGALSPPWCRREAERAKGREADDGDDLGLLLAEGGAMKRLMGLGQSPGSKCRRWPAVTAL